MFLTIGEKRNELETIHVFRTRISYQDGVTLAFAIFFSWNLNGNIAFYFLVAYILEAIDKMWKTNTKKIEGRGRVLYQNFFCWSEGTESERDACVREKYTELTRRGGAGGLPRRCSQREKANSNNASFWSCTSTSRESII